MLPKPGPPRIMFTMTTGSSAPAIYVIPSCLRLMPGEEEEVITRAPQPAAPYAMLIAATSLSACRKTPPCSGMCRAKYSGISFCGVIG